MVLHLLVFRKICLQIEQGPQAVVDVRCAGQHLQEDEAVKGAVVELTDASADPEAVVVEFAYASVALPTVFCSIWYLINLANFTASVSWNLHHLYISNRWLLLYLLVNRVLLQVVHFDIFVVTTFVFAYGLCLLGSGSFLNLRDWGALSSVIF